MAVSLVKAEDSRVPVFFSKKVSTAYIGELYGLAINALKQAGKSRELAEMKERINRSGSAAETLKIMQVYVRFHRKYTECVDF